MALCTPNVQTTYKALYPKNTDKIESSVPQKYRRPISPCTPKVHDNLESLVAVSECVVGLDVGPVGAPGAPVAQRGELAVVAELAVDLTVLS